MTNQELEKLYNEAYKAVYWTAFSILKNEEDAEDVVQDIQSGYMSHFYVKIVHKI